MTSNQSHGVSIPSASDLAIQAAVYLFQDETLCDRFIALSGVTGDEVKARLTDADFQASLLEFFMSHEPDLIDLAEALNCDPAVITQAWRTLAGGEGYEW